MQETEQLIAEQLGDWRAGWSMGSFGAIAEFHRDDGTVDLVRQDGRLSLATQRGAIAFDIAGLDAVVPIAYETLSPKQHRWSHAVALCLPEAVARRPARPALTERGPDRQAIRAGDRDGILFDIGLSLPQCDFCVRVDDPALLDVLRANTGRAFFEPGNPVPGAILAAHPHRVVITNIGRIEVYQKIGGPETGGVSPEGPHTHLLPKLLKSERTHSANTPIPAGFMPLGAIHPANPVITPLGEDRPFDPALHEAFQTLIARYAPAGIVETKNRLLAAIANGAAPESFAVPSDRFARAAFRLALRQQHRVAEHSGDDALLQRVVAWRQVHSPEAIAAAETDDDAPGH